MISVRKLVTLTKAAKREDDFPCVACGKPYGEHSTDDENAKAPDWYNAEAPTGEACPGQEFSEGSAPQLFHHPDVTAPCEGEPDEMCPLCASRERKRLRDRRQRR